MEYTEVANVLIYDKPNLDASAILLKYTKSNLDDDTLVYRNFYLSSLGWNMGASNENSLFYATEYKKMDTMVMWASR